MAPIDDKVVAISFESSKFESGVNKTIDALGRLKAALNMPNAGKNLLAIGTASKAVDLGHIAKGVDSVVSKLGAMRLTAIAVFANVAQHALAAGLQVAKAFTINPAKAGFAEYTTNLNAVQTILANTQAAGVGLKQVNAALLELNQYSDRTIYNFSQMAKNIGTFTAAGVELGTATQSIKGIANLAALSGSNAEQASTAMYQLSQAIAAGKVSLMDWNSVVNAGMGGTVFQRALAQTAEAMGTLKKGAVELEGPMKNVKISGESFRQSLSTPTKTGGSWLTSDVLTTTLKQFTGDLKDAELAAMGFNDAQIKSIQATAKTAMHAATEVKTLKQVLDVARETAGSGWAQTWQIIFGNFGEAKTTFTALSNAMNGFINASSNARNKVLADWKALGGRTELLRGIKEAFRNLILIMRPIKDAFHDIFPSATGKQLYDLTLRFKEFAKELKPSPQTMAQLRLTFQGFFAVLHIGVQIIGGLFAMFGKLFGTVHDNRRGILDFTSGVGQFLVSLDEALQKGNRLTRFFEGLGNVLGGILRIFGAVASSIKNLFSGFSAGGFSGQMGSMSDATSVFGKALDKLLGLWERFVASFSGGPDVVGPIVDSIVESIQGLGPAISQALSQLSLDPILQVIKTGLFAALVMSIRGFLGKGAFSDQLGKSLGTSLAGLGGGLVKNISASFSALTGSLVAMQTNIKAKTLKEIAIAVGILAASVIALSFVDAKKLGSSLTAMSVAFGELIAAMALLTVATRTAGFIKLPLITASLILLAGAIDLLTLSVLALSLLSWEQLAKGLAGVGAMLAIVSAAAIPLSASSGGLMRAGLAMIPLAIGLRILASAVGAFADMNWTEMGKGFVGIGVGLGIIAAAMHLMPKSTILIGAGLVVVAAGLKLLASVVMDFADMEWSEMGKGLAGIGAALLIIGAAMHLFPKSTVIIAVGLIGLVAALAGIQKLVASFGGMSLRDLGKGLGGLAASLAILAGALYLMSGTLGGAAALGIAATALALLVPSILMLGRASWTKIIKGLVVLAATLAILGVAAALLSPVIPALLGLGLALVLIGAGMAALGAGIWLIAAALSTLIVALPTGVGILIAAFNELMEAIPEMTKNFILGMLEVVNMISIVAPQFVEGILKIIEDIVTLLAKAGPTVAKAFGALLAIAIKVIHDYAPQAIQAGFDLLMDLLTGIKNNIGQVATSVATIISKFLTAIAGKLGDIIRAGTQLLVSLIKGIANVYPTIAITVLQIITRFLTAIANNLPKIVTAGISIITKLLTAIAQRLPEVVAAGANIIIGFVRGIGRAGERIVTAARESAGKFINTLAKQIVALADQVFTALITLINGMATVIENRAPELRTAARHLGFAIIDGMTGGLLSKAQGLYDSISGIMGKAMGLMHKIPGVHSPSTVTHSIGENIILGLVNGLDRNAHNVYASATAVSNGLISSFTNTLQIASPSKVMIEIGKAVGDGFAKGIRGSAEDIKNAFAEMNKKLTEQMTASREIIASEQEKLDKLRAAKKPDAKAIKEAQETIKLNQELLARSTAGHILLTKALKDEKAEMIGLANDYEKIGTKPEEAKRALADLVQQRKDYQQSLIDQYATAPDISGALVEEIKDARGAIAQEQAKLNEELAKSEQDPEAIASAQASVLAAQAAFDKLIAGKVLNAEGTAVDQLATYVQALNTQTTTVAAYQSTLQQLRKLGLDDVTYQKLLKEGPADQAFANQLLAGGKTAVRSLNTLDGNLMKVSKTLATNAASNLKDAGIKSAQGLINGLKSQHDEIRKEMEEIARMMIRSLKKELGIKSPSQAFAEIGKWSMEGMAQGFTTAKAIVTDAVDQAAKDALAAMKSSMRSISDMVTDELNPSPIITPILDLSMVRSQAEELGALTKVVPITAAASYGQASLISSEQTAAQAEQSAVALGGSTVKFEQNNYSPESLSEIEIYRQTKNQLSQLKSVLAIT